MCTGAELPLIMQGVGLGTQVAGAVSNSKGAKAAYNAQAQVDANNAQIAEYQAQDAERRGEVSASDRGLKTNELKGAQRVALAANGVDLSMGSALEIQTDTDYFGGIDRARILDTAAREAWGYRTQGANFQGNADLLRGRAAAENPYLSAGTTFLTSAGKVASGWYGRTSMASPGSANYGAFRSSPMAPTLYSNRSLGD